MDDKFIAWIATCAQTNVLLRYSLLKEAFLRGYSLSTKRPLAGTHWSTCLQVNSEYSLETTFIPTRDLSPFHICSSFSSLINPQTFHICKICRFGKLTKSIDFKTNKELMGLLKEIGLATLIKIRSLDWLGHFNRNQNGHWRDNWKEGGIEVDYIQGGWMEFSVIWGRWMSGM